MTLTGHIVLITGAAGTLGRAAAEAVRVAGGAVVATDLRPGEGVDLAHDVTSEAGWAAVIAECGSRHGRLDGLVTTASAGMKKPRQGRTLAGGPTSGLAAA